MSVKKSTRRTQVNLVGLGKSDYRGKQSTLCQGCVHNSISSQIISACYELDIVPDLAESWKISDGGCKYIFHLRDDVYWSDGIPVVAGDFVFTCERILDPVVNSPHALMLLDIVNAKAFHNGEVSDPSLLGIKAINEVTLEMELERPTSHLLHLLSSVFPVPPHKVLAFGERWAQLDRIVTNGPFLMKSFQPGGLITLARNPKYHGNFGGNLNQIEITQTNDWIKRLELYKTGDADALFYKGLEIQALDRARQQYAGEYLSGPFLSASYLAFDVTKPPFNDPLVRRAFAMSIDKQALASIALRGYHAPANGGLVPAGMPGHLSEVGIPYSPSEARELLGRAGYKGSKGFPCLDGLSIFLFSSVVDNLQTQWRENLEIDIDWEIVEWEEFPNKERVQYPGMIVLGFIANFADPSDVLDSPFVDSRTGWQNDNYDRLIEDARQTFDQRERIKLYQKAERILIEDAVIIPLTYARWHLFTKPWVSNYPVSPVSVWYWRDVIIEPH